MKNNNIPYSTLFISAITFLYSMYVAFDVNGKLLSNVTIVQLEAYGGVTFTHLQNFEFWRIFASQLIHAKQIHMFYNVLSLIALGVFLERYLHAAKFFGLWFFSGAIGTLVGTLFITPPWNIGTGASQAVLGIAAFGLILSLKGICTSTWFWLVLGFSLIPAFALDFIYVGHPKPGHVTSAVMGLIAGLIYAKQTTKTQLHIP